LVPITMSLNGRLLNPTPGDVLDVAQQRYPDALVRVQPEPNKDNPETYQVHTTCKTLQGSNLADSKWVLKIAGTLNECYNWLSAGLT
jgi:hypothetical protein